MTVRLFRGDAIAECIDPANRGLAYGDGLFETMRVHQGVVPMWQRHLVRLRDGARRLGIPLPASDVLTARVADIASGHADGVLKLLLARGPGGRGYASVPNAPSDWQLSLHALPAVPTEPLRLHGCETRLALQPALAGIKHCNRLEQVLACAEVERAMCDEGLLRDTDGNIVSATSANLMVLADGGWITPPVDQCGVAGVLRGWLLEQGLVQAANVSPSQLESAEALALCNAVRGILPVRAVDGLAFAPHPATNELKERLAMAYPMFGESGVVA